MFLSLFFLHSFTFFEQTSVRGVKNLCSVSIIPLLQLRALGHRKLHSPALRQKPLSRTRHITFFRHRVHPDLCSGGKVTYRTILRMEGFSFIYSYWDGIIEIGEGNVYMRQFHITPSKTLYIRYWKLRKHVSFMNFDELGKCVLNDSQINCHPVCLIIIFFIGSGFRVSGNTAQ